MAIAYLHQELGFKYIWTILAVIMTHIRLQNYTNLVVGVYGIQAFKSCGCCVVVQCFVSTSACPLLYFGQVVCPNYVLKCQFEALHS